MAGELMLMFATFLYTILLLQMNKTALNVKLLPNEAGNFRLGSFFYYTEQRIINRCLQKKHFISKDLGQDFYNKKFKTFSVLKNVDKKRQIFF
jgi:hypothetical protein